MQYRTLFVSDIHLGSAISQADVFLAFLKEHTFEQIYIIGDFIDFWAMKRNGKNWKQSHNDVLQKILRRHRKGTGETWIAGNHDEFIAQFDGMNFGGINIKLNDIHIAADGKKYLLMHGHELDAVMKYAKWLMHVGSWIYDVLIWLNPLVNGLRRFLRMRQWSLSQFVKYKCKQAVSFIGDFEDGIAEYAKRAGTDGVIVGHIHHPEDRMIDGIRYLNCGDWVESMTAIVENFDGSLEILHHKKK